MGIYDLKYTSKSGRIPSAAALIATKLNFKSIIKIFNHSIATAAKYREERKLWGKIAKVSIFDIEPGSPYELIYENSIKLHDIILQHLSYEPKSIYQIGSTTSILLKRLLINISIKSLTKHHIKIFTFS